MAGGPELQGGVGFGGQTNGDGVSADDGFEVLDVAVMAAVEAVGDAEKGGEFPDTIAVFRREGDIFAVRFFRRGPAVVTGDVRH